MAYQEFRGQFALPSAATTMSVGGTAVTLTEADYYVAGYTGETATQLCEHIQVKVRAIGSTQDASTVVYSGTTGRVTITLETAATLALSSALATILGFTSTSYGSASSFTAERQPRYVWRPTRSAWDYPTNITAATFWPPRSSTLVGRSKNGTTRTVAGHLLYDAALVYRCLTEAEVKTPSTGTVYADCQQFFVDCPHAGKPIRFYCDRTLNTSTDFVTFVWGSEDGEPIGAFLDYAGRHNPSHNTLWDVEIPMLKYV